MTSTVCWITGSSASIRSSTPRANWTCWAKAGATRRTTRAELRAELGSLRERFIELWRRDNEASEIGITLALYDNALAGLS